MTLRLLVLGLAISASLSHEAKALEVRLVGVPGTGSEVSEILLEATGSQGGAARSVARGLGSAELVLGDDEVWTIRTTAEGFWSAVVSVGRDAETVRVELWPAAQIVGTLSWPNAEPTPKELKVRFDPAVADSHPAPIAGEEVCDLLPEGGRFSCRLPAGHYDLRLRARGFVSVYLWDRHLRRSEKLDLGELTLTPGSSVAGFVETEDRGPFDRTTQVELVPQVTGGREPGSPLKLGRLGFKVQPTDKGFFHFPGVPEGMYRLEARQAGYAGAVAEGVDVAFGYESRLRDPLLLTRPRELQLQIEPATDSHGESWRLQLVQLRREKNAPAGESFADELGLATFTGLSSGDYFVLIYENRAQRPFHYQELKLDRPSTFALIELPVVELEGEIFLGEEPLVARLVFGGSFSPKAAEFRSDEEGKFRGFVSEEGEWEVEIESEDPPIYRTLRKVMVKRRPGKSVAELELRLPDIRLEGRVVAEAGQRPPRTMVYVRPEGEKNGKSAFICAEDGSFELRGMSSGRVYLYAGSKELDSDEVTVDLAEGVEAPFVELVLRERRIVQGMVLSDTGPVPGASIRLRPWGSLANSGESGTTDAQGNFEIALPKSAGKVHAEVKASGYGLLLDQRDVSTNSPLLFEVSRSWGEIEVLFDGFHQERWLLVSRGGGSSDLRSLLSWARLHVQEGAFEEGRVLVPRLAPGSYQFCLSEPGSATWMSMYMLGQALPKGHCDIVDLQPSERGLVDFSTGQTEEDVSRTP